VWRRSRARSGFTWTHLLAGAAGAALGLFMLRSLPDLVRYVKIERM
jgi:hypothetical protein